MPKDGVKQTLIEIDSLDFEEQMNKAEVPKKSQGGEEMQEIKQQEIKQQATTTNL